MTTHSPKGIYQYVSQVSYELLGYYPQKLIGRSIPSFSHPQDQPLIQQFYQELQQKKSLASVTYRMAHKDGHYLWIETVGKAIIQPQTGDIKEIFCVSRDITKSKQIEQALIQAEKQYHKIFEKSNQGIFKLSPDGYFVEVNPALAQLYGYDSPQELLNTIYDLANQLYVNPRHHETLLNVLEIDGEIISFQSKVYCKNRKIIDVEKTIWAVYDEYGKIIYYQGTVEESNKNIQNKDQLVGSNLRDLITNLPNRQWFYEYLEKNLLESIEYSENSLAIILIHLDNLQLLNESLNITQDRDLLTQITRRLQSKLRAEDTLAKLGDDELVLLVRNQSVREIILIAKRILNIIHFPFEIGNNQIFVRVQK